MNVKQYPDQARVHQFTHRRIHRQARRWQDAWLLLLLLTYGRMYLVQDLALVIQHQYQGEITIGV
jgi:hypothetical protein